MATAQIGMTVSETRTVLGSYLHALVSKGGFGSFFADDIVVTLMDSGQEVRGRVEAEIIVNYLHNVAFRATPEVQTVIYGEGIASAELIFAGRQVETFEDIPPSNEDLRVPYAVVWELENGKITSLRLYQFASALTATITALANQA